MRIIRTANFHVRNPCCFLICFISDNFYILSLSKKFVNNFFYFFQNFFESFFQDNFSGALRVNTGNPCRFNVFCRRTSAAYINISYLFRPVNKFFKLFYIFQLAFHSEKNGSVYRFQTEKEGFEPSRRVNDLHP